MKPTEIIDAITQLYVKPALQARGFKKKGSTFWRDTGEVIDVVTVQKSPWNDSDTASFAINLGLYWKRVQEVLGQTVATLPPREYHCTVRQRLGRLFSGRDFWWEVKRNTETSGIGSDTVEKLLGHGLPWLEAGHDLDQTIAYVERMNFTRQRDAILALRQKGELQ